MTFRDRIVFCNAPLQDDDDDQINKFVEYAEAYASDEGVQVRVSKNLKTPTTIEALHNMESLFRV